MSSDPSEAKRGRIPEAETGHIGRKKLDVPYASISPAQQLDIYWPDEGDGPFPVIMSIHGGAFMGGDKRDTQLTPVLKGLERGYAVVSINYRMSGEAIFPALVQDMKAAIRWVRAHAQELKFDPDRIAVWGGSAGGYQALMAGVSEGIAELDDLSLGNAGYASAVQAVVAWFPPTNFSLMDEQLEASGLKPEPGPDHSGPESPESLILGAPITEIPDVVKAANPETYVRPGLPPMLIQHGSADSTVPYQGSLNFACKLAAANGQDNVRYEILLNAKHGHGEILFSRPENVNKVLDFIDGALHVK
jgi:acetyl esterase/lipase